MRRKIILITVLVLLMLFAVAPLVSLPAKAAPLVSLPAKAAPLVSLPAKAEESAGKSETETINAQPAATVIFSDGFESGWYWTAYETGTANNNWGIVYDNGYVQHSGTHSAWCAATGTRNPVNQWYYMDNMDTYMYRAVPSGYTGLTLSYYYWTQNEVTNGIAYDYLRAVYWYNGAWYTLATHTGSTNYNWYYNVVSIPSYAQYVGFYFHSDGSYCNYFGAYIDDVLLQGTPTTQNTVLAFSLTPNPAVPYQTVALSGTLKTTGGSAVYPASVTVEYSTDGGATWHSFNTLSTNAAGQFSMSFYATGPGTFLIRVSYAGSSTYSSSSHTETLTVQSSGAASVEIWTDKATYARGETLKVYIQGTNPGLATTVKVNAWFGLPGGGTYGLETIYNGPVPASYTGPVTLWKQFTIPTSAAVGTYSVNAEIRNPTTNALIDSDTYYFTVT